MLCREAGWRVIGTADDANGLQSAPVVLVQLSAAAHLLRSALAARLLLLLLLGPWSSSL